MKRGGCKVGYGEPVGSVGGKCPEQGLEEGRCVVGCSAGSSQ